MALGISERMIQRAFGAQDLSPIYNTISAANQRIAAEERARRIEAEKRYYTELADINKQKVGIREADIPEVTSAYNEWSSIEKQLSSNPSLITKNPEKYGELKSKSNNLYSKMLTTIQGSKEFANFEKETYRKIVDPNNIDDWDEAAASLFKTDVISKPLSAIRANNLDDVARYRRKDVDGSKFYNSLPSAMSSVAKYEPEVPDETYTPKAGISKVFKYKNLLPSLDVARNAVELELNANIPQRQVPTFAKQELDKAIGSGDYQATIQQFNKVYSENQKKLGLPEVPADIFDEKLPPRARFINYVAAKQFVSNYANPTFKSEFVKDPFAFGEYQSNKAINAQIARENRAASRFAARLGQQGGGVVSIAPLFKKAATGGETGVAAMLETSNAFNTIGFAEQMFPFTAAQLHQGKEGYSIGTEIVSTETDKAIRKNSVINNPQSEEGKEQAKKLADAINKSNKTRGFFDTDVTPAALLSGRVMVMTSKDKDGNNVNLYLNVAGPSSTRFIDRKLGPTQMSAKEKRQSVGGALLSTGAASPSGFSYVIDENGDVQIINE